MSGFIKSLKKVMGAIGAFVEESAGEYLFPTARVKNDPVKQTIEDIPLPASTPLEEKQSRQRHNRALKRRYRNFTEGVDLFKNFQKISIEEMIPCADNWNYFEKPNTKELLTLMGSIECIGVISPLVLVKQVNGKYLILNGQSRALALKNLYNSTKDDKYKYAPAFILDWWEVDEYYQRILVLDANMNYRTIGKETMIKAIIERYELLKRTKQFRSESNIAQTLADEFLMSKSSIFNYLCFRKLREEIMVLLLEGRVTLQCARYLSRVDHNTQLMILEEFGVKRINEVHRIKFLTNKDKVKLPELKERIEVANNLVPHKTAVTVTMDSRMLSDYLELVGDFKKHAIINYENVFKTKNCNTYCKVSYNADHMKYYMDKEIIDPELLKKVDVKNYAELEKVRG